MTRSDPVFIGGLADGGKTRLRIALEVSPRIAMTRKTYLWRRYHGRYGDLRDPSNLKTILETMGRDSDLDRLSPDYERVREEFLEGPATYCRLFGLLHAHHAEQLGMPRWGDQEGLIERFADSILAAWPEARMIHLIRDPRTQVPVRAIRNTGKLGWFTAKWVESADLAFANLSRHDGRYSVIRFEDLAVNPERTIRDVCSFIGEEYTPSMVDAFGDIGELPSDRPDRSDSTASFIEGRARERMRRLGYRVHDSGVARTPVRPFGLLGFAAWHIVGSRVRAV